MNVPISPIPPLPLRWYQECQTYQPVHTFGNGISILIYYLVFQLAYYHSPLKLARIFVKSVANSYFAYANYHNLTMIMWLVVQ